MRSIAYQHWTGMSGRTAAGNILINPASYAQHAAAIDDIIDGAGPLAVSQPWFFPSTVSRIHRQPLCGDDGKDLDDQMQ